MERKEQSTSKKFTKRPPRRHHRKPFRKSTHRRSHGRPRPSGQGRAPSKKNKHIIGIIPARMGSSRFPGKPLADIAGKAMIYHVYHRSVMSSLLDKVYVATPDQEIREYCLKNNMNVVLTKHSHQRASDRAAEALQKIEKKFNKKIDILVMIQGDEPLVRKEMIDLAVKPLLEDSKVNVSNLVAPLKSKKEFFDPNEVKVVADRNGYALYFSREPIPSPKKYKKPVTLLKQVCIIPFQRQFLLTFNELQSTPLEQIESIDMLRCLEHGYRVKLVFTDYETYSVDTKNDLRHVKGIFKKDSLVGKY